MLQTTKRELSPALSQPTPIPPDKKLKSSILTSDSEMAANTASAQVGSSLLDEPVIYRDLKAWIEQQEQNPRPLSPLQKRAIADLIRRQPPEPDLGDRDWVTLLNRKQPSPLLTLEIENTTLTHVPVYAQAHRTGLPTFTDDSPAPERFMARCQFRPTGESEYMVFPSEAAGFLPDESGALVAPCFHRKKDAKQYAAKCCIEYLMNGGFMPTDGVNVEFPKPKPVPNPPKAKKTKTPNPPTTAPTPARNTDTNYNSTKDKDDAKDSDTDPPTTRVADLCRLMGLVIPTYKITPSAATASINGAANPYWDGYADFGADSIKVPEGLGRVANVYGKKNAREKIVEEVLAWLVKEEKARREEAEALMAQLEG
jgi:hypothetical protein